MVGTQGIYLNDGSENGPTKKDKFSKQLTLLKENNQRDLTCLPFLFNHSSKHPIAPFALIPSICLHVSGTKFFRVRSNGDC
jgi:hypothetical protein